MFVIWLLGKVEGTEEEEGKSKIILSLQGKRKSMC